jgi:hypothetical protein
VLVDCTWAVGRHMTDDFWEMFYRLLACMDVLEGEGKDLRRWRFRHSEHDKNAKEAVLGIVYVLGGVDAYEDVANILNDGRQGMDRGYTVTCFPDKRTICQEVYLPGLYRTKGR